MTGPCAKVRVECVVVTPEGREFRGSNNVRRPQSTCPREPGEGYGPCRDICGQPAHAEIAALGKARDWAVGATALVHFYRDDRPGHVCTECFEALLRAGVSRLIESHGTKARTVTHDTWLPIAAPRPFPIGHPRVEA